MHTKNKTVTGQGITPDEFTYDDEHDRLEQIMAERNVLLNALQRISESVICWQDNEANALLEGVGIIATNAVNQVFQMEGMDQ
jgi:hypothetical protein